ncbi:ABC transporter permease [Marinomonas sp. 15G1-11]|uniref:ABC transporter permease n=1 Tax=Marinomonas phaeophyticola TaxID=3004091 RepID=A0ABT4JRV7_9GAMM|nr:ABC transporter permease [Marinomonas sp. 15G1-11]MCZ2720911.1 ABC transporter permease [Marinomonas sp. 15G1-11]
MNSSTLAESPKPKVPTVGTKIASQIKNNGALWAFFLLLVINILITPNFLQIQTLYVNLTQVATVAIVAIGMTLVIASGGIDLSVGALMALAGTVAPMIFLSDFGVANPELGLFVAIVVAISAAGIAGLFNGFLISKYKIQPIIATLILFISGRGIAQVLTNGELQTFDNPSFEFIGTGRVFGVPVQAWITLVLALSIAWVLKRSIYGRFLLAVGGNEKAAELAGVPATKVKLMTYMVCGLLAGIAGIITTAINSASDANQTGQLMELDAISAAIVGGVLLTGGRLPSLVRF